jgi:hypothetical protein
MTFKLCIVQWDTIGRTQMMNWEWRQRNTLCPILNYRSSLLYQRRYKKMKLKALIVFSHPGIFLGDWGKPYISLLHKERLSRFPCLKPGQEDLEYWIIEINVHALLTLPQGRDMWSASHSDRFTRWDDIPRASWMGSRTGFDMEMGRKILSFTEIRHWSSCGVQ